MMRILVIIIAVLVVLTISVAYAKRKLNTDALNNNDRDLKVGDKVPGFTLKDQDGRLFDVNDYIGKYKLVIFFYPKDESAVCTKEACAFRDSYTDYTDAGAMVIGINSGSVESHKAFQQHQQLPFTLLSDENNKVLELFGIKNVLFLTGRETFVIDKTGHVAFKYRGFLNGDEHNKQVLAFLRKEK